MAEEGKETPASGDKKKDKDHKWIVIGGVGTLVLVYLYYRSQNSSSSTATTVPTTTTSSPVPYTSNPVGAGYGAAGLQSLSNQVSSLQSGISSNATGLSSLADQISKVQSEISGLTPPSGTTSPLSTPASTPTAATTNWMHIPNPTAGGLIANNLGAQYQTVGNAQYANPSQVVEITNPSTGASLLGQGYNVVGFGGHEWYNPQQVPTPGKATYSVN